MWVVFPHTFLKYLFVLGFLENMCQPNRPTNSFSTFIFSNDILNYSLYIWILKIKKCLTTRSFLMYPCTIRISWNFINYSCPIFWNWWLKLSSGLFLKYNKILLPKIYNNKSQHLIKITIRSQIRGFNALWLW